MLKHVVRQFISLRTAISAVLLVIVLLLWSRSYTKFDGITWIPDYRAGDSSHDPLWTEIGVDCVRGYFGLEILNMDGVPGMEPPRRFEYYWQPTLIPPGFVVHSLPNGGGMECWVPMWAIFLACLLLHTSMTLRLVRKANRGREVKCAKCGYDLRASAKRCPECGLPF